jgi:transposase
MSRVAVLTDAQWTRIAPLMPSSGGVRGRPFRDHRQVVEGIIFRLRTGCPWRDLPQRFGPHQTVSKRHRRFSRDGTWDKVLARLVAEADAVGQVDWTVSVDSTINRAHQHATTMARAERPAGRFTGGGGELHDSSGRPGLRAC